MTAWWLSLWMAVALGARPVTVPEGGAVNTPDRRLEGVGFDQKLEKQVPGDLPFTDPEGRGVRLGDYFGSRPVVLALVYFGCPNLCTMELNGLFQALDSLPFRAGTDFTVIAVSIDPREGPAEAAKKRNSHLAKAVKGRSGEGIHFLTGTQEAISRLAAAVGFRYRYDEPSGEYAHPSGILVLTPEGKISRYLFGIEYAGKDLRLALVEASAGRVGSPVDTFLLFCFHYDPLQGGYGLWVMGILRAMGILTVALVGGGIAWARLRERRHHGG